MEKLLLVAFLAVAAGCTRPEVPAPVVPANGTIKINVGQPLDGGTLKEDRLNWKAGQLPSNQMAVDSGSPPPNRPK
jgi:hypothetical protein